MSLLDTLFDFFSENVEGLAKLPYICGNFSQLPLVPQLQKLLINASNVVEFCKRGDIGDLGRDAAALMKFRSGEKDDGKFNTPKCV